MAKELVLELPSATLWYHPEEKIVHHCVHKFIFGDDFKALMLGGLKLLQDNKAAKWLSNDSSNTALRNEDVEWGNANWFPACIKAGWKHWAIVQPKAVIAQINMDKIVQDFKTQGINVMYFSDEDEAFEWLKKQ